MSFNHKFRIKADVYFCMIHCFPTCLINSIHNYLVKLCGIYTRFAFDTACSCITARNCAVVEQKNLGISLKSDFIASVNRHICYNSTRRILSKIISLFQSVDLNYIISVKCSFNDRSGFGKTCLTSADFGNWIIRFC